MKKIFNFTIFLSFFLFLSACNNNIYNNENELTLIRLAEVVRSVFYAPQYIAIELGFFEDEGIEILLNTANGADRAMVSLIANEADIGLMGTEAAIYVFQEGRADHAIIFSQLTQRAGNFLISREYIENFTWDMVLNKTIIGGRIGGMPQMVLEYILYNNSIIPGYNIEIITNLDFTTTAGAFISGIGDFTVEFDPTALSIEMAGHGYVVSAIANYTDNIPYTVFMANRSFLDNNEYLVDGFVRAIDRAIKWLHDNSSYYIANVISNFFPYNSIEELEIIIERYKLYSIWGENSNVDIGGFYLFQNIMKFGGELFEIVDHNYIIR